MPLSCPYSLVAFFPEEVYRNVGACDVLPQLVKVLGKLAAVQFLRNGVVRVTFLDTPSCDAVLQNGFQFQNRRIRVQAVEQRSHMVYLRDLPCEVPDGDVLAALRPFGEITLCRSLRTMAFQASLMALGSSRCPLERISYLSFVLLVSSAASGTVASHNRAPLFCRAPGHRVRDCPVNGLCHRARHPGHVARDCRCA